MSATGKTAVVTGAASGIGEAVVQRLLREGADVLAVDVDAERLASVAAAGAEPLVADLGTEIGCAHVAQAGAGADYLVNSAGIIRLQPILEIGRDDWRDIFRINAEAIFFLCQQLGPTLREGGAIVNLSSVSAKLATTLETAAYAASKTTVLSITRSFAYALAPRNVRVNAICPGIIDTPMQDKVLDDVAALRGTSAQELSDRRTEMVPLARGASASECAAAIWFLLSDESSYMTGEAMNFSGGLAMW
jgi:NAD(P)-dependent dehydrogenase (short-subunit alcohol dehydrogenase family)